MFLGRWFDRLRANGVGFVEAILEELLGCVHAVAYLDARGFAAQGFCEEACDVFTVFGEAVNLVLYVCWVAHKR